MLFVLCHVTDLRNTLYEIHNMAREKMLLANDRQKKAYDLRQNFRGYNIGETVCLHNPARKVCSSKKLHCPWTGPFLVVERISDLVYKIQKSPGDATKCVHHDRLKPSVVKLKTWLKGQSVSTVTEEGFILMMGTKMRYLVKQSILLFQVLFLGMILMRYLVKQSILFFQVLFLVMIWMRCLVKQSILLFQVLFLVIIACLVKFLIVQYSGPWK